MAYKWPYVGIFESLSMSGVLSSAWVEPVATGLGVLGVWLMIRQSLWNFPVGLVQVTLSALIFYRTRLYAEVWLQVFFFVVLAYGWAHWSRPRKTGGTLPVTQLSGAWCAGYIAVGLLATGLLGQYLFRATDAPAPYRDAFIASFSVVLTWLQARKRIENWVGWVVVNGVACTTYFLSELYWFGCLYLLFMGMAVTGYFEWRKALRANNEQ